MKINLDCLTNRDQWESAGVSLPKYDIAAVKQSTLSAPIWVHFGAGNIFRGYIASLMQSLLDDGYADRGIIAVETFDHEIIEKIYDPHDNLTLNVLLNPDSTVDMSIIASIVKALKSSSLEDIEYLRGVFKCESLQMISFTVTEKGYVLHDANGELLSLAKQDMEQGPQKARHAMSIVAMLLLERYKAGAYPIAAVSMDNCSHNGEKLKGAVLSMAQAWVKAGFAEEGFIDYLEQKVSFPWSMIDKITPRPAQAVQSLIEQKGIEGVSPIVTSKGTHIAAFVNAEKPQYLVIEDSFPNGRVPLEKAGVYMTDRDTVNKVERMKVTTCLNPLHTAMSMYGCLLGYTRICEQMKDKDIVALIKRLGYDEGLKVVTDPKILSPKAFIDEVVEQRLPNPFMPDDPRRIATDTSQKVGIRFGETIKSYINNGMDLGELKAVALAIAGWFRYLLGVDDEGNAIEVSPDPLKQELQDKLSGIAWNNPAGYKGQLCDILQNERIFGCDLTKTSMAAKIEQIFIEELGGAGAVRATLQKYLYS